MATEKKLIIVGLGGFGREVAWLVERINKVEKEWDLLGFLDDAEGLQGKVINGYPVLGKSTDADKFSDVYFVCAVGASIVRKKVIEVLKSRVPDIHFATLVDPSVDICRFVEIGEGSIICAGSILTVNIKIGKHVIVNLDCTIGHDAVLQDFVTLYTSVNVSGNTLFEECTEIGTGTQIIQGKLVGAGTIVGAGAVVVKDLPENCTAVGLPAKPIKFH